MSGRCGSRQVWRLEQQAENCDKKQSDLKPTPRDVVPPARLHLLSFPNQLHYLATKYSNVRAYRETFLFQPPQGPCLLWLASMPCSHLDEDRGIQHGERKAEGRGG